MSGMDCSGFVQFALALLNLDPKGDQSSGGLMDHFIKNGRVVPPYERPDLGDLAFFGTPFNIEHVALCLGDGKMMEAGGGGKMCRTKEDAEAANAKVRVVQIDRRKDLVAIIRPNNLPWNANASLP